MTGQAEADAKMALIIQNDAKRQKICTICSNYNTAQADLC